MYTVHILKSYFTILCMSFAGTVIRFHEDGARGPRMCICLFCGKKLKRKKEMLRHVLSHTKEKYYSCELCRMSFCRKASLKKHQKFYHR